MARAIPLIIAVLLAGCASSNPLRVEVPVMQRAEPPAELLAPITPPAGVFSPPGAVGAIACITPSGKDGLVSYVDALRQRVAAWEAWAR